MVAMFLAQEFDAVDDGTAYISAARPRACQPELLSRLIGYLANAPEVAPGLRTDGVWVWPETLVEQARRCGAAPQRQFSEHLRSVGFLLPPSVPDELIAEAARVATGPPAPEPDGPPYSFWAVTAPAEDPRRRLLRIGPGDLRAEEESCFFRDGWDRSWFLDRDGVLDRSRAIELSAREAAALIDQEWARHHAANLAAERETVPTADGPRLARVFDGESPQGLPWFSPARPRIADPERRRRLAAYLSGGQLVVRTTAQLVDPLGPGGDPSVPLSFRTDGVWVWQEALAHYVRTRGLGPELDLLRHIEERGYRLPPDLPGAVLAEAATAVRAGPRLAPSREPWAYAYAEEISILLRWPDREYEWLSGPAGVDMFDGDLLWSRTDRYGHTRSSGRLQGVSETEAIQAIDELIGELGWASPGFTALR
jgi:hypothetical protein